MWRRVNFPVRIFPCQCFLKVPWLLKFITLSSYSINCGVPFPGCIDKDVFPWSIFFTIEDLADCVGEPWPFPTVPGERMPVPGGVEVIVLVGRVLVVDEAGQVHVVLAHFLACKNTIKNKVVRWLIIFFHNLTCNFLLNQTKNYFRRISAIILHWITMDYPKKKIEF